MTISDPIGDMLTRIRNAQMKLHPTVLIPSSKFKKFVLITWEDICAFNDWKNLDAAKKIMLRFVIVQALLLKRIKKTQLFVLIGQTIRKELK